MSELKDSGSRKHFGTGAVRDGGSLKGRLDLVAVAGVMRQALQMERGAAKYSARNWEKGMPLSVFLNSGIGHILAHLQGFDDEPHIDAAIWNFSCLAETEIRIKMGILPKELDDLPHTFKGRDYQQYLKILRDFKGLLDVALPKVQKANGSSRNKTRRDKKVQKKN